MHYTTPLTHLGVLRATGADAATFLHNQLTQDMLSHTASEARRSAWCSAKGRMLASFISVRLESSDATAPDAFILICSKDVLESTLKRLRMFVLRADCKLEDASDDYQLVGSYCHGSHSQEPDANAFMPVTALPDGALQIHLPAGSDDAVEWVHHLCLFSADTAIPEGLNADKTAENTRIWQWLEVMTGIATVNEAVREALVPQMLNYESLHAVHFQKGCYPGQEVVARSQYRGVLKRRAYLAECSAELNAGMEVFHSSRDDESVGTIVQAAEHPEHGWYGILSTTTASTEDGTLHIASPDGAVLRLLPLPYDLVPDV